MLILERLSSVWAAVRLIVTAIFNKFIRLGDTVSQVLGSAIHVPIDCPWWKFWCWKTYSRTANESVSGASNWHSDNGRWPWVEIAIDVIFFILSFGRERNHCLKARINDRSRAGELLASDKPLREL